MKKLHDIRKDMRQFTLADDMDVLEYLAQRNCIKQTHRDQATQWATHWIEEMRAQKTTDLMDIFMAEYGLSNSEGIALMCLAEALLRVPDAPTIDALIEDKIAPSDWAGHLGRSSSPLVNASTWALLLTGKVLDEKKPLAGILNGAIKRVGEPIIRIAVIRAMRELGKQFVLGQHIDDAINNGEYERKAGYNFSYDMLGEAAVTSRDALDFFESYKHAITKIMPHCHAHNTYDNPGISIKLSALFERYELSQKKHVIRVLVPRVLLLAQMAKKANMGLNIDAEEASRLELSMDVIEKVLSDDSLAGWDGFGIVVQAYGKRAHHVISWFYTLAKQLNRKVMVRLVKGAYWDTEIKLAQIDGLDGFPVFTSKAASDISYIQNAAHLLALSDVIYSQFATHNAHSVAIVKAMAGTHQHYEFQRLHGMGKELYNLLNAQGDLRCRIYAPVGEHEDLLAYLVRRLLENGANSSFVNQVLDRDRTAAQIAADPFSNLPDRLDPRITHPHHIFAPRHNSKGWNIQDVDDIATIMHRRAPFIDKIYNVRSIIAEQPYSYKDIDEEKTIINPAIEKPIGQAVWASKDNAQHAITHAKIWHAPPFKRAAILRKAADIYENNAGEIFAILAREAGKNVPDAIAELREAVDFLRFYADEAEHRALSPKGVFTCISPWNFPLAIFTGQVAAALAAGNAVIAKPAEQTPIIASLAVKWLHDAGVPIHSLQLLLGKGPVIGPVITGHANIDGVCFTGSTATAQTINKNIATYLKPDAPFIAETGGINAMIIDSTALPEQAVRDIMISAFQSAGQRCSACRIVYIQDDIADKLLTMLYGAMDALTIGNPWEFSTDIGPVIDASSKKTIDNWINEQRLLGRVKKELKASKDGHFVAPTIIELDTINQLTQEIFGPILHIIRYKEHDFKRIIDDINAIGYGLTFGFHSRIDDRVATICHNINVGNIYINRNQIGAIVGSQPFGGKGLSGTGPKAGGPLYLHRFSHHADFSNIPQQIILPGPTGESNIWMRHPCGKVLCLGPTKTDAKKQKALAIDYGCDAEILLQPDEQALIMRDDIDAVIYWGDNAQTLRITLAKRTGKIIPIITSRNTAPYFWAEKHICIDITASGGNADLIK